MIQKVLRHLLLVVLALGATHLSWGQGSTTASINGAVTDAKGEPLPGATVLAIHTPTNTTYGVGTNADGRFNIQGMRLGGPYTIKITFVGQQDFTRSGIFLTLGQNLRIDATLNGASTELNNVVVTGRRDPVINAARTGAATDISREQIAQLPTLGRQLSDFTRLTPQAGGGGSSSFGGANNRYNNITIDGAVNNDVFGLAASGTPGGQAGSSPIALDALDQIQVVLAPYDVTLGSFTGAGVNAVTRSGTNDVSASIYGFGRNQNSIGLSITEPRVKTDEFSNYTTGARFGLPLVKDKIFLFVNGEINRQSTPLGYLPGTAASQISVANLANIASISNSVYGYDPGSYLAQNTQVQSSKIFGRLDFNLGENTTLTLRDNYVKAFTDNNGRSVNSIRFGNNGYRFSNRTNSAVAELNSRFSSFSNKLILTYTYIRDSRDPAGAPGPQYTINDGGISYTLGQQASSVANQLDQDIVEVTDNLTRAFGKHQLTIGTHNEGFKFRNLFLNNAGGSYTFTSIANFQAQRASAATLSYAATPGGAEAAFKAAQLGFYIQDAYTPVENFRLTYGLRLDVPVFVDKPANNEGVAQAFGSDYSTTNTPNGQLLFSPRIGFNYDVNNDSKVQLRGGVGVFTGRVPFVWISNDYTNTGLLQGAATATSSTSALQVYTNPADIIANYGVSNTGTRTALVNVMKKDFKLPQVFRANLASDIRLPGDVIATVEGIYSKTLNDIVYRDLNLAAPVGRLSGPDQRPVYGATAASRRLNQSYTNVLYLDNTNQGYRYSATLQLQKRFAGGLNTTVAYTYGTAKEVNSGTSSVALSNYQFNQVAFDPNNPELGYSINDQRHRIISSAGYTFRYAGDKLATTFTLFYEGLSGQPLSYVYGQGTDLNRDGFPSNDLFYIPKDVYNPNEIKLASDDNRTLQQVQAQLDQFINNDPYLRSHRGQVAERFAARLPWSHEVDIRLAQDFNFLAGGKKNTIQFTFDIINAGNLLNNNWGRKYFVSNNALEILGVANTGPNVQPTFTFPAAYGNAGVPYTTSAFSSRWQGQLGVRYSFN